MCNGVSAKVFDLWCGGAGEHSGGVDGPREPDWDGPAPTCRLDAVAEEPSRVVASKARAGSVDSGSPRFSLAV
jgi:hypothetical protein